MQHKQKITLIRILLSAVVFIQPILFPIEGLPRLILFFLAYLVVAYDVIWTAAQKLVHGRILDEHFLMALATLGAIAIGEYPEAVAVMLFYQVGELLQDIAVGKSRKSIADLMDIRPDRAVVVRDGAEQDISPSDVQIGETIVIRAGEKVPLDGVITEGATSVDAAALTGESLPLDKGVGDSVLSGMVNLSGRIHVAVQTEYEHSTVSKILELVENAASKKAQTERFISRFARYYTPVVVIVALLLATLPPIFLRQSYSDWIYRALVFLVISCPCALVISVPLSFFGGIGGASRKGILIKGGTDLERLSKAGWIAFDKTGTLTKGTFTVTAVHPQEITKEALLEIAAAAESYSSHPLAQAIVRAHGGEIQKKRISEVTELAGMGVRARIDGEIVHVGNAALMEQVGVYPSDCPHHKAIVHIACAQEYMGHIEISDEIKPDAPAAIASLRARGISRVAMLTGDSRAVGESVGKALGIDEIKSNLLPGQKVAEVERLLGEKPKGKTLVYVGDGINDAPVLSRSDVGIAMGALGSDAAIEAADVVITDDQLDKIRLAIQFAKRTMRIVHQNIAFALLVKLAFLVLGAVGITTIWLAVFADVGVTVLVVIHSMRTLSV